jgi:multidrug transporter EmrE-like cation transporter
MEVMLIIIILLIVLAECSAQAFTNRYFHEKKLHLFLTAVSFYGIVVILLSRAHSYTSMSTANAIWSALSIMAISLTGLIFFKQPVQPKQWVALIAIAVCVGYLIATSKEPEP